MSIKKVICNKCGHKNNIFDETQSIVCENCHKEIDLNNSLIYKQSEINQERTIYEIENKVIRDELCDELLNNINVDNDLIKYLNQKNNKNKDLSWLDKESKYYNLIIKDVLRSVYYSDEDRKEIISTINNNELYNKILDESTFKTEESKEMTKELASINIDIAKNAPHVHNDLFVLKMVVGFFTIILILLFGLLMDKDLAKPTVIILSILPACIIGLTVANKVFKKLGIRIIMCILFTLLTFYIVSYIETLPYNGFIGIIQHAKNIIHAIPDFVNEMFKRLEIFEEIVEDEGGDK